MPVQGVQTYLVLAFLVDALSLTPLFPPPLYFRRRQSRFPMSAVRPSNLRGAYALFSQETLDKSTRGPSHKPMLFALCFFHCSRSAGASSAFRASRARTRSTTATLPSALRCSTTTSRTTPRTRCRGPTSSTILAKSCTATTSPTHTTAASPTPTSRCCSIRRSSCPAQITCSRPATRRQGTHAEFAAYIEEKLPAETPLQFGLHPNSQISLLQSQAADFTNTST